MGQGTPYLTSNRSREPPFQARPPGAMRLRLPKLEVQNLHPRTHPRIQRPNSGEEAIVGCLGLGDGQGLGDGEGEVRAQCWGFRIGGIRCPRLGHRFTASGDPRESKELGPPPPSLILAALWAQKSVNRGVPSGELGAAKQRSYQGPTSAEKSSACLGLEHEGHSRLIFLAIGP